MGIICTHTLRIIVSNLFDTIARVIKFYGICTERLWRMERDVRKWRKRLFELAKNLQPARIICFFVNKTIFSRLRIFGIINGKWYRMSREKYEFIISIERRAAKAIDGVSRRARPTTLLTLSLTLIFFPGQ